MTKKKKRIIVISAIAAIVLVLVISAIVIVNLSSPKHDEKTNYEELTDTNDPIFTKKSYPKVTCTTQTKILAKAFEENFTGEKVDIDSIDAKDLSIAYQNLVDGKTDIVIATEPSEKMEAYAETKGLKISYTPLCYDALVFYTNYQNIVEDLTVQNIRDIYSGAVSSWSQVKGRREDIIAYQKPSNSDAQIQMQIDVMDKIQMIDPICENYSTGATWLTNVVSEYKNEKNAIGYSLYSYISQIYDIGDELKLLSVDSVEPSVSNIKKGNYRYVTNYYVATISKTENIDLLKNTMLSSRGQSVVSSAGYIPTSTVVNKEKKISNKDGNVSTGGSLEDTYKMNNLKVEATNESIEVSGLKDTNVEKRINKDIKEIIDGELDAGSEILNIVYGANYANVVSFGVYFKDKDDEEYALGFNYRLDTGGEIRLKELFKDSFSAKSVFIDNLYKRAICAMYNTGEAVRIDLSQEDYSDIENKVLELIQKYESGDDFDYMFTTSTIYIFNMIDNYNGKMSPITITMPEEVNNIAIFKKFANLKNIYRSTDQGNDIQVFMNLGRAGKIEKIDSQTYLIRVLADQENGLGISDTNAIEAMNRVLDNELSNVPREGYVVLAQYACARKEGNGTAVSYNTIPYYLDKDYFDSSEFNVKLAESSCENGVYLINFDETKIVAPVRMIEGEAKYQTGWVNINDTPQQREETNTTNSVNTNTTNTQTTNSTTETNTTTNQINTNTTNSQSATNTTNTEEIPWYMRD